MVCVIYRMTVIYNPNIGIITKIIIISRYKLRKKRSFKATIVVLQSVFFSTPFHHHSLNESQRYLCTDARDELEVANAAEQGEEVLKWHFEVFGVCVMSVSWTILNGTLTDWNLYWLCVCVWRTTNLGHWAAENVSNRCPNTRGEFIPSQRMWAENLPIRQVRICPDSEVLFRSLSINSSCG